MARWHTRRQHSLSVYMLSGFMLLSAFAGAIHTVAAPLPATAPAMLPPIASPTPGCGRAPFVQPGATADETIAADPAISEGDSSRTYRTHLPSSYQSSTAYPVVLIFHGSGGNDADMENVTGFSSLADQDQFIAVYPQGLMYYDGTSFWASIGTVDLGIDDVRFASTLLDALEADLCIDTTRIYATGFSNGGAMTGLLACQLSDRIAAFAAVSGNFYAPQNGCNPSRPIPILEIHGTADPIVSYYGIPESVNPRMPLPSVPMWLRGWAARDACAADPVTSSSEPGVTKMEWTGCAPNGAVIHYRIEGGGHHWPPSLQGRPVAAVFWDFFQAHPLPSA